MAVVIETTLGDITVDLFLEQRPVTCLNFLKLCKMKYYNFNLFHSIRSGFIAQTGDPTGEGSGGESIFGLLEGREKRFFSGEKMPKIRHTDTGMISMVGTGDMMVGSQFFFTLGSDLDSLDGNHCVIGEVTEGQEVLRKLNEVICDETHRPYQDVRITHTVVLEDPYTDPAGFRAPSRSPSPSAERLRGGRIAPDEELDDTQGKSAQEIQEMIEEKEAKARATILEMVGDLPDADIAPPENVLFVCKLNPVTTDEDLEIIFSRFGKIVSCEVIRDKKTGDSLQYAFVEFTDKKCCEDAYFKMDNVLIDDRRIHVDFSQSVSKIKWLGKGRGVKHLTDEEVKKENSFVNRNKSRRPRSNERDGADPIDRFNENDRNRHKTERRHREENQERSRNRDERERYWEHRESYMDKGDKKEYEKERERKREVKERHQDDKERHRETNREKKRDDKVQERNDRETRKPDKRNYKNQDTKKRSLDENRDNIRNIDAADRRRKNKERHNSERTNESDDDFKEKKRDRNHGEKIQNENDTDQYHKRHTRDAVYESKDKYGKEKKREDRVKERKLRDENIIANSKDKIKNKANNDAESDEENGVKRTHKKNHSIEKNIDSRKSNHFNSDESHSKDSQVENITSFSTKSSKKLEDKDKTKSRHSKHEKDSGLKRNRVDKEEEHDSKRKRREQKEDTTVKTKYDNKDESKALAIYKPKQQDKNKKRNTEDDEKLQKNTKPKKKRKVSTSSSDSESSSSSSSSSESSSSSDSDRKKKKARRRKRKASSSTSSSSSDSSTSSSSDSSSESSSSSSDSDVKSKKSRTSKKKMLSKKGKKK